ncbi:VanW family protein [Desulforamulus hydrothermalis]|uniref:VanW family protein n=1 Tax=Desulforamulus hydrothermalis Lam5 = DSM 18033 TaxID=1121428 RepID=K8E0F2_9FIRM|nr:VanW family protein [Desulforamulus hydrothermalis]CCO09049.1 VanW family protein [Desulforamulus hydrothermalis Lam5 = DSM 18033]SHG77863.1 Vancomycin resistance protein YoaR, contains peptidoglycan-binding and VanW domains [Desulforamulus hydrothermalis Lam5 = DSM 18033]
MTKQSKGAGLPFLIGLLGLVALVAGVVSGFWIFQLNHAEAQCIPPGIFVEGIDLSNLDRRQAAAKLQQYEQTLLSKQIQLSYQDQAWHMTLQELGFMAKSDEVLNLALQNNFSLLQQRLQAYFRPVRRDYHVTIEINKEQMTKALESVVRSIERPARNAELVISDHGRVMIQPDQKGYQVNLEQVYKQLLNTDIRQASIQVNLAVNELIADKTTADIEKLRINGKIAEFTTKFDANNVNRTVNIRTAAARINGVMLAPGQEFSFNKVVGERTGKAGYRPAAVIVANKFEEALGGGICQVSTTLYNAILLAGLTPVERHNHSLAIGYVPLGRDAAVAWQQLDFKFKNTLPGHLYLRTVVTSDAITVQVFGDTAAKKDIVVRSWVTETIMPDQVIKEYDPALPPGEEVTVAPAYAGFRAKAERIFKENGTVVKREALPDSYYQPRPKIVKVGQKTEQTDPNLQAVETEF